MPEMRHAIFPYWHSVWLYCKMVARHVELGISSSTYFSFYCVTGMCVRTAVPKSGDGAARA